MSNKRATLGRNLNALLGVKPIVAPVSEQGKSRERLRMIPIELLSPGKFQPRQDFEPERLQELADSIKAQGVLQPIIVRPIAQNQFEIIAGERRWRASQLAGLREMPAIIKEFNDEDALAIALIENIQREDLNPLEEARALQRLIEEFGKTHEQAATAVGKSSRTAVTNLLRLLQLNDDVKTMLEHGDLEMGHARALLSLESQEQSKAAGIVVSKGLSVRETEKLVKRTLEGPDETKKVVENDPDIMRFQENLSRKLGAKIQIQHSSQGKGKLIIHYNSPDELEGILSHVV